MTSPRRHEPAAARSRVGAPLALALALMLPWASFFAADARSAESPSPRPSPRSSLQVEIDRIEISGISLFERTQVENALDITAGDRFERLRVIRTGENLQSLYRLHGYEEARVRTELVRVPSGRGRFENVLRFLVVEGRPTRIQSVRLIPQGLVPESFETDQRAREGSINAYWESNRASLLSQVGIVRGDIMDQERIDAGKRALQEALASEEFIGARVREVRVNDRPGEAERDPTAFRWVDLEFYLDLGDRVSFGFRGNTAFTRGHLMGLINEQRRVGFAKDYVVSIRERIEQEYWSAGYARVKIQPFTFERTGRQERHVTYVIDEGGRFEIDQVDFDGNVVFSDDVLRQQFFARAPDLTQSRYFVEKEIERSAELLVEWMKSQGFLGSKLVTVNRTFSTRGKKVNLTLYLYEGDQSRVRDIELPGVQAISPAEAQRLLGVEENQPLNLYAFNEGLQALKASYRARGYLDMKVVNEDGEDVVRYADENRQADIRVEVAEGPQFRAGRIEVEGLEAVAESVVFRELAFSGDEVLEEGRLQESEARLRRLGLFSGVAIRLTDDPERANFKNVKILIEEGTPGLVEGRIGYRSDLGIRLSGQVGYNNLFHRNHSLSLNAAINHRALGFQNQFCVTSACFLEYQIQPRYVWPYFLGDITTMRAQVTVENIRYILLDAETQAASLSLERPILRRPNLTAGITYAWERVRQTARDAADARIESGLLLIGSIAPSLKLDLRDNPLAPTSGFMAETSFELSSTALGSQSEPYPIGYTRFVLRTDYHLPLFRNAGWYFSFRTGFARNLEPPPDSVTGDERFLYRIPQVKTFFLGGVGSVRGFPEQSINATQYSVLGTTSYVNYRTQIDLPFAGAVRFGPFLDAANVNVDTYSLGNLLYGTGFGFRYMSPVGPVSFDFGFNLNPRPAEPPARPLADPPAQFYFSIGVI